MGRQPSLLKRVTTSVLISDVRKEDSIIPSVLMFAVIGGKLGIYALHNTPEVIHKVSPHWRLKGLC